MKYIKGSTSTKEKFDEVIVVMGIDCGSRLTLNVPTHCNTACDMLELALHLNKLFMS